MQLPNLKNFAFIKHYALALFLSVVMTSSLWGDLDEKPLVADLEEKLTLEEGSEKAEDLLLRTKFLIRRQRVRDINIGYLQTNEPVPLTPQCLFPQEVFGTTTTIFARAAVEPTFAVNPKNPKRLVAAWQQDRISNGGGLEIGIAFSRNGGKTWRRTTVPFQLCIGGIIQRASDPWLSYSADGKRVYLNALVTNATVQPGTDVQNGIVVAISKDDGETWGAPHILDSSLSALNAPPLFHFDDKNSITADRNHPRLAYSVWDTLPNAASLHSVTTLSLTRDGGKTWTPPTTIYHPFPDLLAQGLSNGNPEDNNTITNNIVVLPKRDHHQLRFDHSISNSGIDEDSRLSGDLLNFMVRAYAAPGATHEQYINDQFPLQFTRADIAFIRSRDQGNTWTPNATIVAPFDVNAFVFTGGYTYGPSGEITGGVGTLLRTNVALQGQVAFYNVNPKNGYLYVVFQTGQFRADHLPQIALTTSRDGGRTWSTPVQVSRTPAFAPNPQAFTTSVAITKDGYVGVLYHDFRNDTKTDPNHTLTDAWLAIYKEVHNPRGGSTGVGLDFVKEVRLSKKSYIAQNGPVTGQGVMTNGDYNFIVAQGKRFYTIYIKSFNGPFTPSVPILVDPEHDATLLLNNNLRTAPFVSIVKQTGK